MGVNIYSGVGYGFSFYCNDWEELEDEVAELDKDELFTVMQTDGDEETVVVGVEIANWSSGEGDFYKDFNLPSANVLKKLEELKVKMDVMSDTTFHYFFYYQ